MIRDDAHLLTVVRYIALNPATAGLADDALGWQWNSLVPAISSTAPRWLDLDRLLEYLGEWSSDPLEYYRALVSGALRVPA